MTQENRQKPSLRVTAADGAVLVGDAPETDEAPSSPQPIQKKDSLEVPVTRSKSLPKAIVGAFSKFESNRDKQFHKLFENIPQDEKLIKSYPCALVRDVLLQGRMFISANWVCFNANILGFETKVVIPVDAIRNIFKTKYTLLVPSAVSIHTDTDKHVFGSLLSRRATYKKLMAVRHGKSTNDDEEKSIASQDGSYSQDGRETSLTDDQVFEDEEDDSDRSQPFRSEPRKMISGRAHRVKEDKDQDMQNTTRVGRSRLQTFIVQVKHLAESVRAMQLVLPLAILVICCLCVSSCVLACRIARVQAQMQKFPEVAEALEWNRILVTSQSGHMDQVSRLRDSLVLSLQILNKMHSSLQLINQPPTTTTNEMDSLPH
ncbi:GRAM domain-containing protein 2B-like [Patiria miniata]|uniref:GRAM domain-containing protein n=1 Tax=Patiria miniata TaxID=46514 RepID=A0A914BAB5_PATMI|nr:GRAM domain-containing protein 2B-like [Patiria miniata]